MNVGGLIPGSGTMRVRYVEEKMPPQGESSMDDFLKIWADECIIAPRAGLMVCVRHDDIHKAGRPRIPDSTGWRDRMKSWDWFEPALIAALITSGLILLMTWVLLGLRVLSVAL